MIGESDRLAPGHSSHLERFSGLGQMGDGAVDGVGKVVADGSEDDHDDQERYAVDDVSISNTYEQIRVGSK